MAPVPPAAWFFRDHSQPCRCDATTTHLKKCDTVSLRIYQFQKKSRCFLADCGPVLVKNCSVFDMPQRNALGRLKVSNLAERIHIQGQASHPARVRRAIWEVRLEAQSLAEQRRSRVTSLARRGAAVIKWSTKKMTRMPGSWKRLRLVRFRQDAKVRSIKPCKQQDDQATQTQTRAKLALCF